jgi:hypothetical protein
MWPTFKKQSIHGPTVIKYFIVATPLQTHLTHTPQSKLMKQCYYLRNKDIDHISREVLNSFDEVRYILG